MDYGEVLSKAWKIIWKHKVLWLFGFLASCAEGSGGGNGFSGGGGGSSNFDSSSEIFQGGPGFLPGMESFFNQIGQTMQNMDALGWIIISLIALLVILVLSFIQLALATLGRSGMVQGTWQADEGTGRMKFMELLQNGKPYFWRVFLLHFLSGIVTLLLAIVLVMVFVLISIFTLGIALVCIIPFIIILFIPAAMFVDVMLELATIAIIVEDLGIIESVKRAWGIVAERPLQLFLMELILGIGRIIAGFLMALPFLLILIPIAFMGVTGDAAVDWDVVTKTGGVISLAFCCLYLPVFIVLSSVLTAYIKSSWTLTYRRLTATPVVEVV